MKNTWKKVVSLVSILCLMVTVVAVPVNTSATESLFYAPFEDGDQCGFAPTPGTGSSAKFEVGGSKSMFSNNDLWSANDYRIHFYSYKDDAEVGVYKNFDTAISQKVLYGFDLAGGGRLQQSPTDVMFLGSSDVDGELSAGDSDDTMFGLIKMIYATEGSKATGITFYADDILTEGAVSAAAKAIYTTTNMAVWHHVDTEIDFGGKNINYYIDGLYVHSATIPNGALESLKSILLHHKSGSWVETESWYDNFSITTMGGDISATASYQSGVATVVFDKAPAVEINASNVSIKKMSDDSALTINSVQKIDAKTYNFTVSGASVDNAYKVLLTDDVFFAGGFTYNPCSFYINSEADVFEPIGEYNFDNVSSFADLRTTGEVGWKIEGNDYLVDNEYLSDPEIKTDSQTGNKYLAMTNPSGSRSNYFVYQLGLDDNAVKKGIIRFSYDEKMSNIDTSREDYIYLYLLCKIEGVNRYSGASYKQYAVLGRYLNDLGLKFPPAESTSIYSAATEWEHVKDTSASTTAWQRHIIEFDTIKNQIRYYVGDLTNLVRSCGIKSYEGIEGLAFLTPGGTVNEIQMDNVKIEVSKLSVGVESVKFGGKVAKANNAIESGFNTLSVKFSDAVALTTDDAKITVSGDNVPSYTGAYDSATNTYNITFASGFPANTTATLSVANSIVSSGYSLNFTTDNGIFEATTPVISVSGNTATVSTTVTNTTGNGTALILVVQYKNVGSNALKLVSVKPVFELVDGVRDISIDNISIENGADVIKAFVWTGDGTMKPISDFSSEFLN